MATLRFGLIGHGQHGARYAHHIVHDLTGVQLAAICRRDETAGNVLAAKRKAKFFGDYRALIASGEVDAVCAVVPPDLHPEIAEAAAEAGVALLLEKPMAVDMAGTRRIHAKCRNRFRSSQSAVRRPCPGLAGYRTDSVDRFVSRSRVPDNF